MDIQPTTVKLSTALQNPLDMTVDSAEPCLLSYSVAIPWWLSRSSSCRIPPTLQCELFILNVIQFVPALHFIPLDPDSGQKSRIRVRVEMAISTRHTTSHSNRKTGVRKFHREIICKRRKTINLVIFGNSIEIGLVSISDNSGASGSSGSKESTFGTYNPY